MFEPIALDVLHKYEFQKFQVLLLFYLLNYDSPKFSKSIVYIWCLKRTFEKKGLFTLGYWVF